MKQFPVVILVGWIALLNGCGGGGGGGTTTGAGSPGTGPGSQVAPAGKLLVDGHIINPDFLTSGKDFYVNVSYFDGSGNLTSYHEVYEWQGTEPTYSNDFTYTYSGAGDLIREEVEETYTREGNQLYIHDFSEITYTYDNQGQVTAVTDRWVRADHNGDGVYDDEVVGGVRKVVTNTYDSNGRLQTVAIDWGGDGQNSSSDKTTTFEYDAAGNPIKESIDNTQWVEIRINAFDAQQRRVTQTRYATSDHFTRGEPLSVTTYVYAANGNLEREELDDGVFNSSDRTPDGQPDTIIRYSYGPEGEVTEKTTEVIRGTTTQRDVVKYLHEVTDSDGDGTPEVSTAYVFWLDTVFDSGGGYPPEALPPWYTSAQTNLNNGNDNDGWGLNWEGHSTGTCSTCGNMLGQVNTILLGF